MKRRRLIHCATLSCTFAMAVGCVSRPESRVVNDLSLPHGFSSGGVTQRSLAVMNVADVVATGFEDGLTEDVPTGTVQMMSQHIRHHRAEEVKLFGFTVLDLVPEYAEQLGFGDEEEGVVIVYVEQHGPANEVGLRPGMLILSVDRIPTPTVPDFRKVISGAEAAGRGLLYVRTKEARQFFLVTANQ